VLSDDAMGAQGTFSALEKDCRLTWWATWWAGQVKQAWQDIEG